MSERTILAILSDRFHPGKTARYVEIHCKTDGTITDEKHLTRKPKEARFAEVWVNDEGRKTVEDCRSFKRFYRHALEKRPDTE